MTLHRFIHITDLHFWSIVLNPLQLMNKRFLGNLNLIVRRRRYIHTERAASFLELLETVKPDAVLVGGDLTTTATENEYQQAYGFLSQISAKGCPIYLLPGNHDFYTFESCRNHRFEKYFHGDLSAPCEPVLSVLPGDVPLVRIPTSRPNLISSRGSITKEQIALSRIKFSEARPRPTLVLAHYPVLHHTDAYTSDFTRRLANASALREMLGNLDRPILYLAGHVHVFTHTIDPAFPNITHVTSNALFYGKRSRPGGFTEILLDEGVIKVFPWIYREGWTRKEESLPMNPPSIKQR
jgi:DNA repair exonuclease SbcCD nuclease subunit